MDFIAIVAELVAIATSASNAQHVNEAVMVLRASAFAMQELMESCNNNLAIPQEAK